MHSQSKGTTSKSPLLFHDKRDCCGCGACSDLCPASAIQMKPDAEGFLYPRVDSEKCLGCGKCMEVCPMKNRAEVEMPELCHVAKTRVNRAASSSGGMFPLLAKRILDQGGIAFGAAWTPEMRVTHQPAETFEELGALCKTKYVQSDCRGAYRAALQALKQNRPVLFSGTPCQAEAMRRVAALQNKNAPNRLYTAALVCYGVPSPGLWERHVQQLERRHGGRLESFDFRDKRNGDSGHTAAWRINGREYSAHYDREPYTELYFSRLITRPSCHRCPFATPARATDITIGDAWGIKKLQPEFDDGMGVSLVIPNTPAGRELWNDVRARTDCLDLPLEKMLQPRLVEPTPPDALRWIALRLGRFLPVEALHPLSKTGIPGRAVRRIARILHNSRVRSKSG